MEKPTTPPAPQPDQMMETPTTKPIRRRVSRACVNCSQSHATCDSVRPCRRCVERGLGDQCKDPDNPRKRGRRTNAETSPPRNTPSIAIPSLLNSSSIEIVNTTPKQTTSMLNLSPLPNEIPPSSPSISSNRSLVNFFLSTFDDLESTWGQEPKTPDPNLDVAKCVTRSGTAPSSTFLSILKRRLPPNEVDDLAREFGESIARITSYIEKTRKVSFDFNHADYIANKKHEIHDTIEKYKPFFEVIAVPIIVYDRSGVIFYVNPAYKLLTGFSFNLPTERCEHAFYNYILSADSVRRYLKLSASWPPEEHFSVNAYSFACAVRLHSELGEKYLEGTIAVNVKKDFLGIPFLCVGSFLPSNVPGYRLYKGSESFCL